MFTIMVFTSHLLKYYYESMNGAAKRYFLYTGIVLLGLVVFGVSIWGGYSLTLKQTRNNQTTNDGGALVDEPTPEVLETVSEDTQVVNVESLPDIYFQYAFNLTEEIWFSELTFETVTVVEPPGASDEAVMVVDYNGKRVSLPLVGTVGLKIGEGEGKYEPAEVRDLGRTISAGSRLRVGMLFTPSEVAASADEIQTKLKEGLDSTADMYDLYLINIAKRGLKKLTQEEIVQRLQHAEAVTFGPEEMTVSSIEVH